MGYEIENIKRLPDVTIMKSTKKAQVITAYTWFICLLFTMDPELLYKTSLFECDKTLSHIRRRRKDTLFTLTRY